MGLVKGGFQRLFQTFLYILLFCCAGIILGVYSYFLSVQADRNVVIPRWQQAVEGISGAAVLYLIFAVVLTCCLGGVAFFAFLALVLDVLFAGGMIAIAVMTRDGASSCTGRVQTPLGNGPADSNGSFGSNGFGTGNGENLTYAASLGSICRLNTAAFAVSIVAAFLFLCTAAMQVALVRHHKKEKRYGPSPDNGYTAGYGKKKRFGFGRKNKGTATKDVELGRQSSDGMTGTTVGNSGVGGVGHTQDDALPNVNGAAPGGAHNGYYTAPTGTGAVNPYGYQTNNTSTNY